ncbi:MAG: hypothetical protein AB7Q29_02205 [Vicinamibacterales bacterium]
MTTAVADRADAGVAVSGVSAGRRPRIVVILPRGEAIRNFVYSGALTRLHQRAEVVLLSVIASAEYREQCQRDFGGIIELASVEDLWPVRIQRELLDMAHGRWLWSEAAQERWRLRDLEAVSVPARAKRYGRKLFAATFASRVGLKVLGLSERLTSRWLKPTDMFLRLFERIRPDLVFNGSHVHSNLALQPVQAAQWLGIPTATFIFSWDNLTSQGRIIRPYDYYLVWNADLRDQLLGIYDDVRPEQVTVTGTPQFDFHFRPEFRWSREEFCRRVGADPSRPIVLYSTGMANHMPGEPDIVEGLAGIVRGMSGATRPQLLVRVYPKDRTGRFDGVKARLGDVLFPEVPWDPEHLTPRPEDAHLLTNTLRHAAAGVNVASTISLELLMFDRPVVNVGYNPPGVDPAALDYARYYRFDHYKHLVEQQAVSVATSPAALERLLHEALADPAPAVRRGRAFIDRMFGGTLDGRSSERVADALLGFAAARMQRAVEA